MYRIREFFLKRPVLASICFWIFPVLIGILGVHLPDWLFFTSITVFLAVCIIRMIQNELKHKKATERMQNLGLEDFRKMYSQYEAIVEGKVEKIGNYARAYFCEDWIEKFHKYFYLASVSLANRRFTDFHIAACMFFALTPENASKYQVHFAYDCVRNMISAPKAYTRYIHYGNEIELKIEETYKEVDFSIFEKKVTPEEICKIIKEVYLTKKDGTALIELADFLGRLHEHCHYI